MCFKKCNSTCGYILSHIYAGGVFSEIGYNAQKPPGAKFKKGGGFGGGFKGVARGYCPREGHPPPPLPPNEIHSVGHLRTVGDAAQV